MTNASRNRGEWFWASEQGRDQILVAADVPDVVAALQTESAKMAE